MTLVSVQDLGYLAADGEDGGGSLCGGWRAILRGVMVTACPCPLVLGSRPREGPRGDPNDALLAGDLLACSTSPRRLLHPRALQSLGRVRKFYFDAAVNLETD